MFLEHVGATVRTQGLWPAGRKETSLTRYLLADDGSPAAPDAAGRVVAPHHNMPVAISAHGRIHRCRPCDDVERERIRENRRGDQ
jgi:hypothetical protein